MARLPTVGGDDGNWGTILNTFLQVAHNSDGTIKNLFYNVKDYGAVGDGSTNDTSAIQAAFDAATSGGIIFFPPGNYLISSNITVSYPVIVRGSSRRPDSGTLGTSIITTSIINAFVVNADRVGFEDMSIIQNATIANVTSGAGIKFNSSINCYTLRLRVSGWYYGIQHVNGYIWSHDNDYIANSVKYGMYLQDVNTPDAGDQSIQGCWFDTDSNHTPDAAIRYESGGGLKMVNTKVLHHTTGFDLAIADGATTVNLLIANCSFEGQTTYGIKLGKAGTTGDFKEVIINGCQFDGSAGGGTATDIIRLENGVSRVLIANNVITGSSSAIGIHAVGGNSSAGDFYNFQGNYFNSLSVGIQIESTAVGVQVGPQTYTNMTQLLFNFTSLSNSAFDIYHNYRRHLGTISSTSSYSNLFRVDIADRGGGEIEVMIAGTVNSGIGAFSGKWIKLCHRPTGGGAVTLTDVITPVTAGLPFDVQFDTSSQSGSGGVIIGVKRNSGDGGASIQGHIEVKASGQVTRIIRF